MTRRLGIVGNAFVVNPGRQDALPSDWPQGPDYVGLFDWPFRNTAKLFAEFPELMGSCCKTLQMIHRIELHEDYSGTGNCGTALVKQCKAFTSALVNDYGLDSSFAADVL